MRLMLLLFLTFIILFGSFSCKKDYPNDTPDWVVKRIKEIKKENPCNELLISIDEYKNSSGSVLYIFTKPCPKCSYTIYDINGNLLCQCSTLLAGCSCDNIELANYSLDRRIWTEKCKKNKL